MILLRWKKRIYTTDPAFVTSWWKSITGHELDDSFTSTWHIKSTQGTEHFTKTKSSHLLSITVIWCLNDALFRFLSVSMVSCLHLWLLTWPLCWRDSERSKQLSVRWSHDSHWRLSRFFIVTHNHTQSHVVKFALCILTHPWRMEDQLQLKASDWVKFFIGAGNQRPRWKPMLKKCYNLA